MNDKYKDDILCELIQYLKGKKYLIDETSCDMTEEFEKEHQWELSRNVMINKTLKKIEELTDTIKGDDEKMI